METYERNGCTVTIEQDIEPSAPSEWDQLGTLYVDFGRERYTFAENIDTGYHTVEAYIRANRMNGNYPLPVRFDDYGSNGARIYASTDEDANGYLLATPESIELIGTPIDRVLDVLKSEVREWDTYLQGDIYCYDIKNPSGDILDSLCGLYGYEYAVEAANAAADALTPEDIFKNEREHVRTYA